MQNNEILKITKIKRNTNQKDDQKRLKKKLPSFFLTLHNFFCDTMQFAFNLFINMFWFFLAYFHTYHINESGISVMLPESGLIKGATLTLNFTQSKTESFFIAILDSNEFSRLPHLSFTYASQFCSRLKSHFAMINSTLSSHIYEPSLTVSIPKDDVFYPLIVSCKSHFSEYTVTVHFKNGNSLLDSRRIPSFVVMPIEICIIVVCFIPWTLNQLKFRKSRMSLHDFISMAVMFNVVDLVLSYLILWHDNFYDHTNFFHFIEKITKILCDISVLSAIILSAKGWCIIFPNLKSRDVTEIVLFCSLYFMFRTLNSNITFTVLNIVLFALTALLLLVLWAVLIAGIRTVDRQIIAHMLVISRMGIDPTSTPVYTKHAVYMFLKHIIVIYFSSCIAIMSLELADIISQWVYDMINIIVRAGILVALSALFHIRKIDLDLYSRIDDTNTEEVKSKTLDSIENSLFESSKDLIQWREGMQLPPQPTIAESNEESEDGIEVKDEL